MMKGRMYRLWSNTNNIQYTIYNHCAALAWWQAEAVQLEVSGRFPWGVWEQKAVMVLYPTECCMWTVCH